jgi:hypothetical protein
LIVRIFKELKKLNPPNFNDPMKKWAEELNRTELSQSEKSKWLKARVEMLNILEY